MFCVSHDRRCRWLSMWQFFCIGWARMPLLMTKNALWWLSFIFHQDCHQVFILFTAANNEHYLTSYKLVIGIIIISSINKSCAIVNCIYCQHYIFQDLAQVTDKSIACYITAYGVCTTLVSSTHSCPHSSLQRRRARAARDCQTSELIY